jgi:predicted acylesterase/phospholipase RssA
MSVVKAERRKPRTAAESDVGLGTRRRAIPSAKAVKPDVVRKAVLRAFPLAPDRPSRIALAMAGGGPLGAIYEIGALAAIAEAFDGVDLNCLDIYVGVSAGGILGAGLANGITPREMCRMFIDTPAEGSAAAHGMAPFDPSLLMRPAFAEYWSRARKLPRLITQALWQYATSGRGYGPAGALGAAGSLVQLFPTGLFSNEPLRRLLAEIFGMPGRTNDFRELRSCLYLIATDLDSGQAVAFGSSGYDDVPIAVAATASSALPGLFPPVEIGGRHYVDGALKRTLHASVALKEGADLVICLNPLVPYDDRAVIASGSRPRRLIDGGLPMVLLQTIRAVIRSRMEIGMRQYGDDFPQADVLLFEPDRADAEMFFTNMFSYSSRRRLCEHAYQKTRAELWKRRHEVGPILESHGGRLDLSVLRDKRRTLVVESEKSEKRMLFPVAGVIARLADSLDDLEGCVRQLRKH